MSSVIPSYEYSALPERSIRLLKLMPHEDENAHVQGELFDYALVDSDKGTHLYEALSYVWGGWDNAQTIAVAGRNIPITANLHKALLSLRDRSLERIIWVDAVCINQASREERGQQVQLMAEIYSKASRVIIWLGETAFHSDEALRAVRLAAMLRSSARVVDELMKQSIVSLLQRPWFKRIWVGTRHSPTTLDFMTNCVESGSPGSSRSPKHPY